MTGAPMIDRRHVVVLGTAAIVAASAARAAEPKSVAVVAKVAGTAWADAMARGVDKAGADFGLKAKLVGPDTLDPQAQAKLVDTLVAEKVDVIAIVPIDRTSAEPALRRARSAGIKVLTQEGQDEASRDWDIELVDTQKFIEAAVRGLAAEMGEMGEYAIFVDSLTAPAHDRWADAAVAFQKAHLPRLRLAVDPFAGADEVASAYRTVLGALKTYPALKGVLTFGPDAVVGAGNAIREAQRRVALVGTVLPSRTRALIEDGIVRQGFYWNPIDAGYALVATASLLLAGETIADGVLVPGLGRAKVDAKSRVITFDRMMHVDKDSLYSWIAERL